MIPPLERFASNPIVSPSRIKFVGASGTFNPAATIDRASGRVVLLVRVFEEETKRSYLALALSSDGKNFEEIRDKPAITRDASYEEWGVEDARITYLDADQIYAITYTGYSPAGPRVAARTLNPAEPALLEQYEVLSVDRRGRRHVTVPPAALLAVADQHLPERTANLRRRTSDRW